MKYSKYVYSTLISIIITDAFLYIVNAGSTIGSATLIASTLNYLSIIIFIIIAAKDGFGQNEIPRSIQFWFKIWILWSIFSLIRGAFFAKDYWDWKNILLSSVGFTFISFTFFLGKDLSIAKNIFKFILRYLFPYGFLFIPITLVTNLELYSRLMIASSLFILFIPYFKFKWKLLVIIVSIVSIGMMIEFRTNIIKIAFSLMVILIYYFRYFIRQYWISIASWILFILPLVFFYLGVTNKYNVFAENSDEDDMTIVNDQGEEKSLVSDSRTFLYIEVLNSLNKSGNWLLGEGAGGKYQSDFFDPLGDNRGRYGCEVGILNILLYNGIVGVIIYLFLLISVSHIAITQSNNILSKMLGLYIASRWLISFIEEFTQFDLNFYLFWLAIGLVSLLSFRKMSDKEIRNYLKLS